MPTSRRPYNGEPDKLAILALRKRCTTPENVTNYPSMTDLLLVDSCSVYLNEKALLAYRTTLDKLTPLRLQYI